MNVLITGAAGFIGSQLTHRLWKDGVNVVLVDNYSYGSDDNLIFDDCNLIDKVLKVDIRDRERMDAIFSENVIDYVYNIAGIAPLPDCQSNPCEAIDVNVTGFVNILECSRKYGVKKVIQASTNAMYENELISPLEKKIVRCLNKFGIIADLDRSPLFYHSIAKRLQIKLNEINVKNVLFISSHCLDDSCDERKKYYLYVDAVKRPVVEAGRYNRIKRFFIKLSLPKYEKRDRMSYAHMSEVFSLNDWTRQYLIDSYKIPAEKITTVNCGVNLEPYYGEKNYDDNLLLIVLRKGTEYYKGLLLLIDAFDIVKEKVSNAKLAIVGTDEVRSQEGVTYYHNKSRETTVELFKRCTLYTMPALAEPNGTTYVEALANKAPIVGLNKFSAPEFSGYGKYGFMASEATPQSVADVIIEALSDKERLKRMGEEGQQFVMKTFTWEVVCQKMLDSMVLE